MKFDEFVKNVKSMGGIDTDGYYGKQCMDLYNYYCNNVLGLENVGANYAKNILNNPNIMNNVRRIDNYKEFVPQKGDIAVFTGGNNGGHVSICLGEGNTKVFKSLDQNWKEQQLTEEWHDYLYMAPLVFLRPNNQINIQEMSPISTFNVRVDKSAANVRTNPNTKAGFVKQPSGKEYLVKGDIFKAVGIVKGEFVDGTDIWYKSAKGNYVHSNGLTKI